VLTVKETIHWTHFPSKTEQLEQQIKLFPGILISDLSIAQEFKWCNLNNQ